jgi:hypothetical protein
VTCSTTSRAGCWSRKDATDPTSSPAPTPVRLSRSAGAGPDDRNEIVAARHTVAHLLDGGRGILGDGGYLGIPTITTSRRDKSACTMPDNHYRQRRRITACVQHVIARLKDWQILRQCRRRGNAVNQAHRIIAGLWNLKAHKQLRVKS